MAQQYRQWDSMYTVSHPQASPYQSKGMIEHSFDQTINKKHTLDLPISYEQSQKLIENISYDMDILTDQRRMTNRRDSDYQKMFQLLDCKFSVFLKKKNLEKVIEIERLQNQIDQYEVKMSYYIQVEQRNLELQSDVEIYEKRYNETLRELSLRMEDLEKQKQRTGKLEYAIKDMDILINELDTMRAALEEQGAESSQLQDELRYAKEELESQKSKDQNYTNYLARMQDQIKCLEEQLLQAEKEKQQQIQQLNSVHQQQISQGNQSMKEELESLSEELGLLKKQMGKQQDTIQENEDKTRRIELEKNEKEAQLKQMKKDLDLANKKLNQKDHDFKYELNRMQSDLDDQLQLKLEEMENEKDSYQRQFQESQENLRKLEGKMNSQNQQLASLNASKKTLEEEVKQQKLQCEVLQKKVLDSESQNQQQIQLLQQLNNQEMNRLKQLLQLHQDNQGRDQQNSSKQVLEKDRLIREKDCQLKQLQQQRDKDRHQNQLLLSEIELLQAQISEIQNQKQIELRLKDQSMKDQEDKLTAKYENTIKQLNAQMLKFKQIIELRQHDQEELLVCKNEQALKINDLHRLQQHLKVENDTLKQTLYSLQHQKHIEDENKEEVKKRDLQQLKQYHETIIDQMEYEIKGLTALLDQKSKECEEWRSCYLRMKR